MIDKRQNCRKCYLIANPGVIHIFVLSEVLDLVTEENKQILINLFKNAPQYIMDRSIIKKLLPNQALLLAEQKADKVYLHISGTLQGIDTQVSDTQYSFVELYPINVIGEFEAFSNRSNYLINIIAKTNATLISIDSADFINWMNCDIQALNIICRYLAVKVANELKSNREYLFLNSYDRLLLYLYRYASKNQGSRTFTIYKTQNEIADQIGFSVKTISRTMNRLVNDGMITSARNTIKITPEQYNLIKNALEERHLI